MKVLHVLPSLDPNSGGPARSVPALCSAEAAAGADVSLISFTSGAAPSIPGVEFIPFTPLPGTRQGLTPAFLRAVSASARVADIMHVHSLWNPPTSMAMTIAKRASLPYVISPRGVLQRIALTRKSMLKGTVSRLGEARKIRDAAGIHFLSQEEALESTSLALPQCQVVLPNGIDSELLETVDPEAFRKRVAGFADLQIILFLGRLHWSKGLDVQLDAIARVAEYRDDFVWVLIGPDEGESARLIDAVEARGLSERVRWLGALPHEMCLEAIRAARMMIITSRHEAHSMAMNEALALRTPLVMTETVGFPLGAESGATLTVPSDPDAIATAIERVLDDDLLVSRLIDSGMTLVDDFLAWPALASRMIAFYEDVIGREAIEV